MLLLTKSKPQNQSKRLPQSSAYPANVPVTNLAGTKRLNLGKYGMMIGNHWNYSNTHKDDSLKCTGESLDFHLMCEPEH